MKKIIILIAILITTISCKQEVSYEPKHVNFDRDVCHICLMGLTDQRYNVQAINQFGEVYWYDDIGCLAEEIRGTEEWEKWKGEKVVFWIGDASKENVQSNWVDAEKAFYDYGKHTPMGYGYSAYALKPADVNSYSFNEVLKRINQGKTMRESFIQEKMLMMKDNPEKIKKLKKKLEAAQSRGEDSIHKGHNHSN